MQITDVNVYKDKVYLWDCSLQKLFIFDHDGHFLEEKKFDYMAESFAVLDDSWIVFMVIIRRIKNMSEVTYILICCLLMLIMERLNLICFLILECAILVLYHLLSISSATLIL